MKSVFVQITKDNIENYQNTIITILKNIPHKALCFDNYQDLVELYGMLEEMKKDINRQEETFDTF